MMRRDSVVCAASLTSGILDSGHAHTTLRDTGRELSQTPRRTFPDIDERTKFHDGQPSHLLALRTAIQLTLSQRNGLP